jgi:hypothetical protein
MQESLQYDCSNSGNELQSIQYPQRQLPRIELISLSVETWSVETYDAFSEDLALDVFPRVTGSHT